MLGELGLSAGSALIILFAMYFVIKWAEKNAIEESIPEISKAVKRGIEKYKEENL